MISKETPFSDSPRSPVPSELVALAVVLSMAVLRAIVAQTAPLSSDEAYYWQWTRPLALSYYDHPPLIAYWIWAGIRLLGDTAIGVRLAAVVSSALVSLLIWDSARIAFRSRLAGALSAIWVNCTILFATSGVIATPDTPLLFCWSLCLWSLIHLCVGGRVRWIYVAGLALGLGALGKYTMILITPGIVATFLLFRALHPWWRRRDTLYAILLAGLFTLPVLIWNHANHWASFIKQFSHAFADSAAHGSLSSFIGGQIGIVTPIAFFFCLWGMVWALVQGWRQTRPEWFLLGATSLPILAFFADHAMSGTVQAHWPGPAYVSGSIAAVGGFLSCQRKRTWRRLFFAGPILGAVLVLVMFLQASTAILPLPIKIDPLKRLGGWDELAAAVESERANHPGAFLLTEKHDPTGPVSFYLPDHAPVFLEGRIRPSYYSAADVAALKGRPAIFITKARGDNGARDQMPWFESFTYLRKVDMHWGGRVADTYELWLGEGYKGGVLVIGDGLMGRLDEP